MREIAYHATRCTPVVRFVDTNILLYAISTTPKEREKTAAARKILESKDLALSVQVLQELYVQATRSGKPARLTHEQASLLIESLVLRYPVLDITVGLMRAATTTAKRFRISYWDAVIIEAARALDCAVVLSEDLADGQDYGGVVVENPLR